MMVRYNFKYKVLNLINNIYLKLVKIDNIDYYITINKIIKNFK